MPPDPTALCASIESYVQSHLDSWKAPEAQQREWDRIDLKFVDSTKISAVVFRFSSGRHEIRIGRKFITGLLQLVEKCWGDLGDLSDDNRCWKVEMIARYSVLLVYYHEFAHVVRGHLFELARKNNKTSAQFSWGEASVTRLAPPSTLNKNMSKKVILTNPTSNAIQNPGPSDLAELLGGTRLLLGARRIIFTTEDGSSNRCEIAILSENQIFLYVVVEEDEQTLNVTDNGTEGLGSVGHEDYWGAALAIPRRLLVDVQTALAITTEFSRTGKLWDGVKWVNCYDFSEIETGLADLYDILDDE